MSEEILDALVHLFALISESEEITRKERNFVAQFLREFLDPETTMLYLDKYDQYFAKYHKKGGEVIKLKQMGLSTVKIMKTSETISSALTLKQKHILLLRLVEYQNVLRNISSTEREFLELVSEAFKIPPDVVDKIIKLVTATKDNVPGGKGFVIVTANTNGFLKEGTHHILNPSFEAPFVVLTLDGLDIMFGKYLGEEDIYHNGNLVKPGRVIILTSGSYINKKYGKPVYYTDLFATVSEQVKHEEVIFSVENLTYVFPNGKVGLYELTFSEKSGRLVGIMGASGAGKTTLLSLLNCSLKPTSGKILINGIDIHSLDKIPEGLIGYVPQDDLLIEDLTVFQNLYYSAKLAFGNMPKDKLIEKVNNTLKQLGLYEIKDLKVGTPLNKKISGGQRKRLNIALELIREPAILFCDEPTSGLSSRDSENVMQLLKELTIQGKLVFVVIHQPPSDVYKLFDSLIILDTGGYPIWYGPPLDAITHFKKIAKHARSQESECPRCGNVNPEQIFTIVEEKVLDDYGKELDKRKYPPEEFNKIFKKDIQSKVKILEPQKKELPSISVKKPSRFQQYLVFFKRDILAKFANTAYITIALLEAPFLALILSFVSRFSPPSSESYIFYKNENIPSFIFMSVVVSLFLGLMSAAEEIIKDRKILYRERFLNLSKISYLFAKVSILFILAAFQTALYVFLSHLILDIKGMWFEYWIMGFTTQCFAVMLGLNLSSAFTSAVAVYIIIPIMLIPQLLLSGVIIKFEKLHPLITTQEHVPLIGNLMTSRWAYEGLAVSQFAYNKYQKLFFDVNLKISTNNYFRNYWIPEMRGRIGMLENALASQKDNTQDYLPKYLVVKNEILTLLNKEKNVIPPDFSKSSIEQLSLNSLLIIKKILDNYQKRLIEEFSELQRRKDMIISKILNEKKDKNYLYNLQMQYDNEALSEFVRNTRELTGFVVEYNGKLIRKYEPIYFIPDGPNAHLYAPFKKVGPFLIETFWFNVIVIWLFTTVLFISLYYDWFSKFINVSEVFLTIWKKITKFT